MSRTLTKDGETLRPVTDAELIRNCIQLGRFTDGAYNIQWMESVSLNQLYIAIDQACEIATKEQDG